MCLGLSGAVCGGMVAFFHIDYWGRRFLLLGGCFFMAISWAAAAFCVQWGDLQRGAAEAFETSRILSFLFGDFFALFAFSYSLSIGPISFAFPVEAFAYESRSM